MNSDESIDPWARRSAYFGSTPAPASQPQQYNTSDPSAANPHLSVHPSVNSSSPAGSSPSNAAGQHFPSSTVAAAPETGFNSWTATATNPNPNPFVPPPTNTSSTQAWSTETPPTYNSNNDPARMSFHPNSFDASGVANSLGSSADPWARPVTVVEGSSSSGGASSGLETQMGGLSVGNEGSYVVSPTYSTQEGIPVKPPRNGGGGGSTDGQGPPLPYRPTGGPTGYNNNGENYGSDGKTGGDGKGLMPTPPDYTTLPRAYHERSYAAPPTRSLIRMLAVEGPPPPVKKPTQSSAYSAGHGSPSNPPSGPLARAAVALRQVVNAASSSSSSSSSSGTPHSNNGVPPPVRPRPYTTDTGAPPPPTYVPSGQSLPSTDESNSLPPLVFFNISHISCIFSNPPIVVPTRRPKMFKGSNNAYADPSSPQPTSSSSSSSSGVTGLVSGVSSALASVSHAATHPPIPPLPFKLPSTGPDFQTLVTRLPPNFVVLPLANHALGPSVSPQHQQQNARWIAINAERVVGVHGFSPRDTRWTTIVVEGDVGQGKGGLGGLAGILSSSGSSSSGGSERVGGVVGGEKVKGLFSFEVDVPVLEVLQVLDADAFPKAA
ncbi:hypothetical protein HDV05_008249 [Chytridiales sp. JEL 0842]|nr:hypothetical protein HDV05_008249 [Chytridiales sp. JEL 0842]